MMRKHNEAASLNRNDQINKLMESESMITQTWWADGIAWFPTFVLKTRPHLFTTLSNQGPFLPGYYGENRAIH